MENAFQLNSDRLSQIQILQMIRTLLLENLAREDNKRSRESRPLCKAFPVTCNDLSMPWEDLQRQMGILSSLKVSNPSVQKSVDRCEAAPPTPNSGESVGRFQDAACSPRRRQFTPSDETSCNLSSNSSNRKRQCIQSAPRAGWNPSLDDLYSFEDSLSSSQNQDLEDDATSSYNNPSSNVEHLDGNSQIFHSSPSTEGLERFSLPSKDLKEEKNKKRRFQESDSDLSSTVDDQDQMLSSKIRLLVPNSKHHLDTTQMLDEAIHYVRKLQAQIQTIEHKSKEMKTKNEKQEK